MKKPYIVFFTALLLIVFSACSQKENKNENGYISGMLDIKENAEKNISNAVNTENEKINNSLNVTNMNEQKNSNIPSDLSEKYSAVLIKTNLGEIKIKLDAKSAPITVNNFLKLAQDNFYSNVKFHRVIKGFMIQAGDPLSKNEAMKSRWGTGGPGYQFNDELSGKETYPQGTLAMANAGPNTNGSQFFIVTASPAAPLPPSYTVFGQVVDGLDVALKIENVETGVNDQPLENVTIETITPLEK